MEAVSAVILSGGKSRRMGRDKAELSIGGETFLEKIGNNLAGAEEILLSVGKKEYEMPFGWKLVEDRYPGCGPLAGVHAALSVCRFPVLFVVTCDMPFVDLEVADILYTYLTEETDAVIPVDEDGRCHVLCALYRKRAAQVMEAHLEAGCYKVREMLKELQVRYVHAQNIMNAGYKLMNINTPKEYQEILMRWEKGEM